MRSYVASWVKWWREQLAIADVRKFLIVMVAIYGSLIASAIWASHRDHLRDTQHLKLNCACRCDP